MLIIEENSILRENLAELLELNHYKAITANNGNNGYTQARLEIPDIIVCDLMMPESNGRLFLDLAGRDSVIRLIPILFFSYNRSEPAIKAIFKNQHDECLIKPFSNEKLLNILYHISNS